MVGGPTQPWTLPLAIINYYWGMSIAARYEDGVFKPIEDVQGGSKGKMYRVFSEEELRGLKDQFGWLKAAERSFDFWNDEEDAIYDSLSSDAPSTAAGALGAP